MKLRRTKNDASLWPPCRRRSIYIIKGDLFICLSVADGRPNGWAIKTKLGIGTHVDPGSVLVKVKVKVIYLCVWYKEFMTATPGEQQ